MGQWLFEKITKQGIKPELREVHTRVMERKDGKIAIMTTLRYKNQDFWGRRSRSTVTIFSVQEWLDILKKIQETSRSGVLG